MRQWICYLRLGGGVVGNLKLKLDFWQYGLKWEANSLVIASSVMWGYVVEVKDETASDQLAGGVLSIPRSWLWQEGKKKKYIVSSGSILSLNLFLAFQLRVKWKCLQPYDAKATLTCFLPDLAVTCITSSKTTVVAPRWKLMLECGGNKSQLLKKIK